MKLLISTDGLIEPASNGLDRTNKYEQKLQYAYDQRDALVAWLKLNGYGDQFSDVSEPTVFGTFTLRGTAAVRTALLQAPHVTNVVIPEEVELDLILEGMP
jgi:hypothetical protein